MGTEGRSGAPAVEEHRNYLLLIARLEMPPRVQAEANPSDLVHQTILEVIRHPERLDGREAPQVRAYLRQALRRNILDVIDRVDRRLHASVAGSSARLEELLAADHSSPEERAQREEQLRRLADALAGLTEAQRTAVELKHLHGYSVAEISQAMGRSEVAVGGLLRHGIRALRDTLGPMQ
jgi:RNA polymerase sigma factor (sigma-70 family)